MAIERTGEAFELGDQLTVLGSRLDVGDVAPDFELDHLDPASAALKTERLSASAGKVRLLNVVNSLDTPVCQVETRRWDSIGRELPADVVLYTISMDLPYAQARWCGAEQAQHSALSAHRSEQFGQSYGVLIKEWRLLQRAVFVIGRSGLVEYVEYVRDQMAEPDYELAVNAVRRAAHEADPSINL
jgi:thiol peroxidase